MDRKWMVWLLAVLALLIAALFGVRAVRGEDSPLKSVA